MKSLEKESGTFHELNTIVLGMSADTAPSKKAWAESIGIKETRLLSDFWPHGGVAQAHGIFREKNGFSERANIIINAEGRIAFLRIYEVPQPPDILEVVEFLKRL